MVSFILGPREHHGVATATAYEQQQASAIARLRESGARFAVHDVRAPLVAFVSANSWVVNCECGAGNAVDPVWGIACCFGCGAIHRSVVFPGDVAAVEAALLERERPTERHWLPGETPDDLREQARVMRAKRTEGIR